MRRVFLICALLFCVNNHHAAEEAKIKRLTPGTWITIINEDGMKITGETTYKADGTFTGTASIDQDGQKTKIDIEGTWSVTGDLFVCKITKSSTPIMPAGTTTTDTILKINEYIRKYRDEDGDEFTETREKD